MPPVSEERRQAARVKARAAAKDGDWLSQILDHHEQIEAAFAETKTATDPQGGATRRSCWATLLTGHSMAEEGVIYPAVAEAGKQGHADTAYTEQATAKMQLAALERLDPMSRDYLEKLGHLEGAVVTHVYQEESDWFLDLKEKATADDQAMATRRYAEEYGRYIDGAHDEDDRRYEDRSFAPPPPT